MFHVGQKVVCVANGHLRPWGEDGWAPTHLVVGDVYTISAAGQREFRGLSYDGVTIVGDTSGWPNWYDARRFRPLTDISVFTDMLVSVPSDLPADPVEPREPHHVGEPA